MYVEQKKTVYAEPKENISKPTSYKLSIVRFMPASGENQKKTRTISHAAVSSKIILNNNGQNLNAHKFTKKSTMTWQ